MTMHVFFATVLAAAQPAGAAPATDDCSADGRAFMTDYAADLTAGYRSAIAARYSAKGAFLNGFEAKQELGRDAIAQYYASDAWSKPDAFAWSNLSYETVGPDACLVTGGFTWSSNDELADFAYTALLRREDGVWRIRVEHENLLEPPPAE